MIDNAELRRLAEEVIRIEQNEDEPISAAWELFDSAANPNTILALLDEIDRLKAENEALRGALHAVQAEVDGNLRPLTRDLVNMVSGLKNGCHPNDIYEHCDEIERIIEVALEGAKP
ncbi:hypothetical protein [Pseudomonas aeruginosa]|uniref:hypothetical protein n=1 Tax=Pseudomonas aeruginosa TaxID=287 RepID=UPI0003B9F42A|nr:hypothetical protein [Pseudomonas aeruginosa]ERY01420.1 hypothetical protein Q077_05228 [Pseudomonas aeruginosa BL23]MBG5543579.1 hypothetical protein [Pseudomonas aeruginosa]WDY98709.1 hypothetical protein PSH15_23315 [Pseudomonas aeruginosa]WDZ01508.1 hypothetical protein PSH15_05475 [Pseudomonas aeruginosa]